MNAGNSFQNDLYYCALFNQVTLGSEWLKDKSFAPGRMAVDYCYLYTMYRSLDIMRPHHILDIGLGQTTRMFSQYCEWMTRENDVNVHMTSIEHDSEWIEFVQRQYHLNVEIKQFNLLQGVQYEPVSGIVVKSANVYEGFAEWLGNSGKYDFISIDAPFKNEGYSRPQILELLKNDCLSDDFVIMMDDMNRDGEKNTMELFLRELSKKGIRYYQKIYNGAKQHCLITTQKYKFLTSL